MPVIDIQRVQEGDQHLKQAKRLRPSVTARPVPVEAILARQTLTVPELAAIVGYHPNTLRSAIAAGELKAANGGGRSAFRITRHAANEWWQARGGGILFADVETGVLTRTRRTKAEARKKGRGFLKGKIRSSDEFLAARQDEAQAEAQADAARLEAKKSKKMTGAA